MLLHIRGLDVLARYLGTFLNEQINYNQQKGDDQHNTFLPYKSHYSDGLKKLVETS